MLLFLAMETQWRFAGMAGVRTGLDYTMIEATAGMIGVAMEPRASLFLELRTLEREAMTCLAELARKEARR